MPSTEQGRLERDGADPRRQRTKASIAAAVDALSRRAEPLTVAAVVAEAGVSRSTFYAAHDGLGAVLTETMTAIFGDIGSLDLALRDRQSLRDTAEATTSALVSAFEANRPLCRAVFASDAGPEVLAALRRTFAQQAEETMRIAAPTEVDPTAAARYVAAGTLTVLADWALDDSPLHPDRLRAQLVSLLPMWMLHDEKDDTNDT
ncbi:hypothetical protein [Microbacterium marinilacus]|uniref:TetR/AcrR family transcriptional regulator n=1 Tax=Microbacterium marinilacus TaxID=415209 RepID=A0ABP7BVN2_9MICO|nr:hypothetical protein [Microbacterium marinilacus]MBY0688064.1 hypothetical protein [Microbacterium marinilacus]